MVTRGRTTARAGAGATGRASSSTSTSSGSSSASTSSSSSSAGSSGAGAARSSRGSSSVSVSSPSGSKTVTTTTTTAPTGQTTTETTATPKTSIPVSADLARAIAESQANYPDAWAKATGSTNVQTQFETVTGTTIPSLFIQDVETIAEEQQIEEERIEQIEQAPIYERLSDQVTQIINDINNNIIQVPNWFRNNIEWVQNGHINEQEFLTAYNYLVDQQIAHAPTKQEVITPSVNDSITNNMITQRLDNFTIVDGRAKGTITFTANDNFNPYYYGKTIINLIQFKTSTGANILPTIKTNNLRFTATERDETINYDEDMQGNTNATVESFVWEWIDKPLGAFSKVLRFNIDSTGKIQTEGIMGAGVAGAIGILILLGFITDSRRKK